MKAIIYDTETGVIERHISGNVSIENQVIEDGKDILTKEDTSIPGSVRGKIVDTSTSEIIDDPNYTKPKSVEEKLEDLKNNQPVQKKKKISQSDKDAFRDARSNDDIQSQIDILFEMVMGEPP